MSSYLQYEIYYAGDEMELSDVDLNKSNSIEVQDFLKKKLKYAEGKQSEKICTTS